MENKPEFLAKSAVDHPGPYFPIDEISFDAGNHRFEIIHKNLLPSDLNELFNHTIIDRDLPQEVSQVIDNTWQLGDKRRKKLRSE